MRKFCIEGQLIHGRQKLQDIRQPYKEDRNGKFRLNTTPSIEVRPVAFKSMLRYWFKTFTLGILESTEVIEWQGQIFGTITPKKYGWLMVRVLDGISNQDEQQGILTLNYSPSVPKDKQDNLKKLIQNLTWLMFHLGGVGQGARRPCYSRQSRPYVRGSTLIPDSKDSFWKLPTTPKEFQKLFRQRLENFYQALQALGANFNNQQLKNCGAVNSFTWFEALDINAKIVVVSGEDIDNKQYALGILHQYFHKLEIENYTNAKNLCGGVKKDYPNPDINIKIKREVIPSPIWIADLDKYQVVTVFGANADPRKKYLETLHNSIQIFPL